MLSKNEIKYIQSLKAKKQRLSEGVFIAEGPKLLQELLYMSEWEPAGIYGIPSILKQFPLLESLPAFQSITESELAKISLLQSPQQVLMLVRMNPAPATIIPEGRWSLLLEDIQDPGNFGTIIRLADWFGIQHIFCTPGCAEVYSPKVVQASMGSIFRVQVQYADVSTWVTNLHVPLYGATLKGKSIWKAVGQLTPGMLAIGNEGRGLSESVTKALTAALTIPRLGKAESLNAAMAAGILLSHLLQPSNN